MLSTSANPTGWAQAQPSPRVHVQLQAHSAVDFYSPKGSIRVDLEKKKKSELDSTLIARNIIKWVDES